MLEIYNSTINFKSMNQEKFNEILTNLENLDLKFTFNENVKLIFNDYGSLIIQTPFLNIYSINNNSILLHLSEDNNEIQYFINFIQNLENKINNLYNLKKKFYALNKEKSPSYSFNSNFIFYNFNKYYLKLYLDPNQIKIDNSDQLFKINKINNLENTYCNLFLEVKDIWEQDKKFGYNLSVLKIDRNLSHLLPNYSFISSESEYESQDDDIIFLGTPIKNDYNSSSEEDK